MVFIKRVVCCVFVLICLLFTGCADKPVSSGSESAPTVFAGTGGRYVDAQTGLCAAFGGDWTLYSEAQLSTLNSAVSSDTAKG